jgi:hypothetical protein
MSGYDPRLEGTWRAVEVPGERVMARYFELCDAVAAAEANGYTPDYFIACARRDGFVDAVALYCPDVPGYFQLHGHMIMANDARLPDGLDDGYSDPGFGNVCAECGDGGGVGEPCGECGKAGPA